MLYAEGLIVALAVAGALAMVVRRILRVWSAATRPGDRDQAASCGTCSGCPQSQRAGDQEVVGIGSMSNKKSVPLK